MRKNIDFRLQLNITFAILGQITSLIINLISKNAIRSYLGIDYLGLQSIFGNFADIFTFGFSGIGTAMLFHLYKSISSNDTIQSARIYTYFNQLCKYITYIVVAVGISSAVIIHLFINADILLSQIILSYSLYLLGIVIYNRYIYKHFFIVASQYRYLVTIIVTSCDTAALLVELYCLAVLKNYPLFLFTIVIKNIAINIFLQLCLKHKFTFLFQDHGALPQTKQKEIVKNVLDLFVYRIGSVLVNSTDSTITSALISTAMAGYYSNYQFIIMGVSGLTGSFFEAIIAKIGHIISTTNKNEQFSSFLITSAANIVITGITCTCLYLLTHDFLTLWMGADAVLAHSITIIVTVNYYLDTVHRALASYRNATGLFSKINKMIFMKGIINILLSIAMGYSFGLLGILIATAISDIITMQWYEPYLMYQYFKKPVTFEFIYQVLSLLITTGCITVTKLLVSSLIGSTWFLLLIKAIACGFISLLFYVIIFLLSKPFYQKLKELILHAS